MSAQDLADSLVPTDPDLPGPGWLAVHGELTAAGSRGAGELFDCVGPEFPESAVTATGESNRFLRPPRQLVYGMSAVFDGELASSTAAGILSGTDFVTCLSRSVMADLRSDGGDSEVLEARVETIRDGDATSVGNRVSFAGGGEYGVISVVLDVRVLRVGAGVGVVWFGDAGRAFPPDDVECVIDRIRRRSTGPDQRGQAF